MMATAPSFEFCQYVHTNGRRCVTAIGHAGRHDVQPQSSAVVTTINRQENQIRRLSDERPMKVDGEMLVSSIDSAVAEPGDLARDSATALGMVEGPAPIQPAADKLPLIGETPSEPDEPVSLEKTA